VLNFEIQLGNFRGQKPKEGSDERELERMTRARCCTSIRAKKAAAAAEDAALPLALCAHLHKVSRGKKKKKSQRPMAWGTQQKSQGRSTAASSQTTNPFLL
jgi:hypothetical protein